MGVMPHGILETESNLLNKPIWIIGKGGHARSVSSLIESGQDQITFISEGDEPESNEMASVPENQFIMEGDLDRSVINGVGVAVGNDLRKKVTERYLSLGYQLLTVKANSAIISEGSVLGSGVQLFHYSFVGSHATLQDHVVLGTGSIVEHDSKIGTGAFVGPGVTICGGVELGDWSFIGAGAVITPESKVPAGMFVKAGSLITPKSEYR